MGKGERRTARPPRHATHNYGPGIERETNMRFSAMTTCSPEQLRKKAIPKGS
jgi:hypothetical protein